MAKDRNDREGMVQALELAAGAKPYLGDWQTVSGLLRNFVQRIMTAEYSGEDEFAMIADHVARDLAKTFLGQNQQYAGSKWNTPGNIDAFLGHWKGVVSKDPVERVAGALLQLLHDMYSLSQTITDQQLIQEQWTGEASDIMRQYANLFLGIRDTGDQDSNPKPNHTLNPSRLTS